MHARQLPHTTPEAAVRRHPVLMAPARCTSPTTRPSTGEARARLEPAPGRLADVAGGPLDLPEGGTATGTHWIECLNVIDAEVLAEYDHPLFGRWAAAATRRHGAGRVTCVGTVPGRTPARAPAAWPAPTACHGWGDLPASVTVTTGTSGDGRRVHVVHNWSWDPVRVVAPVELTDVLGDDGVPAGTELELGAWDVRVFA
ncbi:hypothetical protein ACIBU0_32040 [Streptomyces sp. NPDC049627]|uniref:hypothetical protein n=1 Tax=Streptomyces sp. NPDC049627 TaxID=3365595 RepID=UPI0037BD7D43